MTVLPSRRSGGDRSSSSSVAGNVVWKIGYLLSALVLGVNLYLMMAYEKDPVEPKKEQKTAVSRRVAAEKVDTQKQDVVGTTADDNNFSLAYKQSYGFFNDITNTNWLRLQDITAKHWDHKYPEQPWTHHPNYDKRKLKYFKSYPAWWQTVRCCCCCCCCIFCVLLRHSGERLCCALFSR